MLSRLGQMSPARQRMWLVALCAVFFFSWISWVPLTEWDEARYSEATREMLESRNFVIPHCNYVYRFQKPILIYWLQSASASAFGINETAMRIPSGVVTLLLVLCLHGFLLTWLPRRATTPEAKSRASGAAFLGALALIGMPLVAIWARAAVTDPTLTFFIALCALALLQADLARHYLEDGDKRASRWYLFAAFFAALAMLTKGPVGLIIPGLAWLVYHLLQRDLLSEWRRVPWGWCLLIFVGVAAPWYVATYFQVKMAFLQRFFMNENVARYTDVMEGHGASNLLMRPFIYPLMSLVALFPFSAVLAGDLARPFAGNAATRADGVLARIRRFGWVLIAVTIGFYAPAGTQLPSYIQPVTVGAALIVAVHALSLTETARRGWAEKLETALWMLLGFGMPLGAILALAQGEAGGTPYLSAYDQPTTLIVMVLLAVTGVLFLAGVLVPRHPGQRLAWATFAWLPFLLVLLLGVAPLYVRSVYRHVAEAGKSIRALQPNLPAVTYLKNTPESMVFYARRKVIQDFSQQNPVSLVEIGKLMQAHGGAVVVTDADGLAALQTLGPVTEQGRSGPLITVTITSSAHTR